MALIALDVNPVDGLAHSVASGAAWLATQLGATLDHGVGGVGLTSPGFLAVYAVTFGAATFMTLILWLVAVAKRVIAGAPLTVAFGEAIGFLWLTVVASAFTPLVLQVVVITVDQITSGLAGGSNAELFNAMAASLRNGTEGGGPIISIIASLVTIIASAALWLELLVRSVAIMVGAVLGTVVYSGLVDRALWSKVRRWAGFMAGLILLKPLVVVTLSAAHFLTTGQHSDAVTTGLAVMTLSLGGSAAVFRFVPGYGDQIAAGMAFRAASTSARVGLKAADKATRFGGSAAGVMATGIQTHAGRTPAQGGPKPKESTGGVSEGIQAHGTRASK